MSIALSDLKHKFFATFKGCHSNEIAIFATEQERDDWVHYQDNFAKLDPEYKNFGIPRKSLSNTYAIRRIRESLHNSVVSDECNKNQKWVILYA